MTGIELLVARRSRGISQQELAHRLGISHAQLSRWEWGRRPIPPRRASQILIALHELEMQRRGAESVR